MSISSSDQRRPRFTREAVQELALRDDAGAIAALAVAASVSDQFVRRTAIEAIGQKHRKDHELQAIVLRAFHDPSEYVIRTACEVAAKWELHAAHEPLVALLADNSMATRKSAIRCLGPIWIDADFPILFRIYTSDREEEIRREAAWVLQQRVTTRHWRTLFDAFCKDDLARHRLWACELAEKFSGPDVVPSLSRLLSDADGHVRQAASRAIKAISNG